MLIWYRESDFVLAMPGKDVTFFPSTGLWWQEDDRFLLIIDAGDGGGWTFQPLKLGTYQIQFTYVNNTTLVKFDDLETIKKKQLENVWTGMVTTPLVAFHFIRN